jgi:hypothetical protein
MCTSVKQLNDPFVKLLGCYVFVVDMHTVVYGWVYANVNWTVNNIIKLNNVLGFKRVADPYLRIRIQHLRMTTNPDPDPIRILRPYLINFDATGSPCHELISWDNSSSMSI